MYPTIENGGKFHKYNAVFLEILYKEKTDGKFPTVSELVKEFENLFNRNEIERVCQDLRDLDLCDWNFEEREKNGRITIGPTEKGRASHGYHYDKWKKYRQFILAGMDARAILLSELAHLNNTYLYFTRERLAKKFEKVFYLDELDELIEGLIKDDILDPIDKELLYTHILNDNELQKYELWMKYREDLLKNGF